MDPFSATSAAAGLVSLGLTVCQGLRTYYMSWKDANQTMRAMYESTESLERTLKVLARSTQSSGLGADPDVAKEVCASILSCEEGLQALDQKLNKIRKQPKTGTLKEKSLAFAKGTLYPFRESTLIKLKERCNDLRDGLSLALAALQIDTSIVANEKLDDLGKTMSELSEKMTELLVHSNDTAQQFDILVTKEQHETLTKIHDWLSPLAGQFEQKQLETFHTSERQDGMARWLVQTLEFENWLGGIGSVLWCTGMQGIGKTVLASFLVNSLLSATRGSNIGVAYVYCSYKEQRNQLTANLVTSLLQQLLTQLDGVPHDLVTLYEDHIKHRTRPLLGEFIRLFLVVAKRFTKVYLIVDGLDECPEANSTRRNFLDALHQVQHHACILITSRYIPDIEHQLHKATKIQLAPNEEDIRNYLSQRVLKWDLIKRQSKKDPTLRESIVNSILLKARKMFLLARLYIESLVRLITLRRVKSALKNLPEGLDDMYNEVIERIQAQGPEHSTLAKAVISWIYFAKRPLRIVEIQHALAIEPEDTRLDEDGLTDADMLVSVCGGLLDITDDSTITFIHYSFQEYLDTCAVSLFQNAECEIARRCITYLLFSELRHGPAATDEAYESRVEEHPFLEYASTYWGAHLSAAPHVDDSTKILTTELLNDSKAVTSAVQVKVVSTTQRQTHFPGYAAEYPAYTPGFVLASSFGLANLGHHLLQEGFDMELEDSRGVRALHEAIWNDQDSMIQFLIENGANTSAHVNRKTMLLHSAAVLQGSSLHLMAMKGQTHYFERLSKGGVELNPSLENGWTPLHMAAENGHVSIVRFLVLQGAEVNGMDTTGATALYRAAEKGHVDAMTVLLGHRADPNLATKQKQTPLLRAAQDGHEMAVALLLEHGADWRIKDDYGWTPWHHSYDMGHLSVATWLKTWARDHQTNLARPG